MPVQYEGIRAEHVQVRTGAGMFDVSHMGEIETSGPEAERFLQRLLSNDVTKLPEGGAQYSVLCREDGGVLDDLFTYRLRRRALPDGHQRRQPRQGPGLVLASRPRASTSTSTTPTPTGRCWPSRGPTARAALGSIAAGELPPRMRTAELELAGVPTLVCGTGYTGEDGCELLLPPDGAGAVWDAWPSAASGRPAWARATRCASRSASTSTATTCPRTATRSRPASAGAASSTPASSAPRRWRAVRARRRSSCRSRSPGPGIPRQDNPVAAPHGAGVVTSGTLSPCLEIGIGMAYVPVADAEPGTPIEVDVRGKARPAEVREKPLYRKADSG